MGAPVAPAGKANLGHDRPGPLVEGPHPRATAAGRNAEADRAPFGHEQERRRDERRRPPHLTERRQVQVLQGRMIARAIAVRHHPAMVAGVEVDGGDAAVGRLGDGQATRAGTGLAVEPLPRLRVGEASRSLHQRAEPREGDGRHVEHAALGIDGRSAPVGTAHPARQVHGALLLTRRGAFERGRREHRADRPLLDDGARFLFQLGREVDEVVIGEPLAVERRRLRGKRLRGRGPLAGHRGRSAPDALQSATRACRSRDRRRTRTPAS